MKRDTHNAAISPRAGAPRRTWCALLLGLSALSACGTRRDFVELRAGERTFGEVWGAVDRVASTDGFRQDTAASDRGLGIYQTRWDRRVLGLGRSGRRRLHCEIVPDRENEDGLMVRFYVEQQRVQDLGMSTPTEKDWDDAGQDGVYQNIFVERLARFLGLLDEVGPTERADFDADGR